VKRRTKRSKKKYRSIALQKARQKARRAAIDLRYMGLPRRDRRRIAEIGFQRWMNEAADAQLQRMAKAKQKAARQRAKAA
jgi:hypothetical protein